MVEQYKGPMVALPLLGRTVIFLRDPETVKHVLFARPKEYVRGKKGIRILSDVMGLGEGLFASEGEDWRRMRKLVSPSFHKHNVVKMHQHITLPITRLIHLWRSSCVEGRHFVADCKDDIQKLTLDVTALLAFGRDLNTLHSDGQSSRDLNMFMGIFHDKMLQVVDWSGWFPSAKDKAFAAAKKRTFALIETIVSEEQALMAKGVPASHLLRHLLEETQDETEPLTSSELVSNVLTLMLAGLDTTAVTLRWALYLLSIHPQWQTRLYDEAQRVFPDTTCPDVTQQEALVDTLHFLTETLRTNGPAPALVVTSTQPVTLHGRTFPADTNFATMMTEAANSFLTNPEVFDPDRWASLDNLTQEAASMLQTAPFGGGTRICPGRNLALVEAVSTLAALSKVFRFETDPDLVVEFRSDFVMHPSEIPLHIILR